MTTKIDRVARLLESATSEAARLAAARQIGKATHDAPNTLHNNITLVLPYLYHHEWHTRRAAAAALDAIARAVPPTRPTHPTETDADAENAARDDAAGAWLCFDSFDMVRVLNEGAPLLASGGAEFDEQPPDPSERPRERLLRQRKQLQARLGMDAIAQALEGPVDEIIDEADVASAGDVRRTAPAADAPAAVEVSKLLGGTGEVLSARAQNQARRRAKRAVKERGSSVAIAPQAASKRPRADAAGGDADDGGKRIKVEAGGDGAAADSLRVLELDGDWQSSPEWPFEPLCTELRCSLFHSRWERRHGAAAGLRAVLRSHGRSAGCVASVRKQVSAELEAQWLEDCCIRLLSVLALDRFGDWSAGDRVTAPVRETSAQALAVVCLAQSNAAVLKVADALVSMARRDMWEARHGALLSLKYLLSSRSDLLPSLLPRVAPTLLSALADVDDDVRSAAATTLQAVSQRVATLLADSLPELLKTLWDALAILDDLTASTEAVLRLLSDLCSALPLETLVCFGAGTASADPESVVARLAPRLFPFFSHPSAKTRSAALVTLGRLIGTAGSRPAWLPPLLPTVLRLLFQVQLCDGDEKSRAAAAEVWSVVLASASPHELAAAAGLHAGVWLALASTPAGQAVTPSLLLDVHYGGGGCGGGGTGADGVQQPAQNASIHAALDETRGGDELVARGAAALGALALACEEVEAPAAQQENQVGWAAHIERGLGATSAAGRVAAAWLSVEWSSARRRRAGAGAANGTASPVEPDKLVATLNGAEAFAASADELMPLMRTLSAEMRTLRLNLTKAGLPVEALASSWPVAEGAPVTLRAADALGEHGPLFRRFQELMQSPPNAASRRHAVEQHQRVLGAAAAVRACQDEVQLRVAAAAAEGLVGVGHLPAKVSGLINALMRVVQAGAALPQERAAAAMARLLRLLLDRTPCPNDKVLDKICSFLASSPAANDDPSVPTPPAAIAARANSGALAVLARCCDEFGGEIFERLPALWHLVADPIYSAAFHAAVPCATTGPAGREGEQIQTERRVGWAQLGAALAIARALLPNLVEGARERTAQLLPGVLRVASADTPLVGRGFEPLQVAAAETVAAYCDSLESVAMEPLIQTLLPRIVDVTNPAAQLGAALSLRRTIAVLGVRMVPYSSLLVRSIVGALAAQNQRVREEASAAFADLMPLLPLEEGAPEPATGFPGALKAPRAEARRQISQLLDGSKLERFKVPVRVDAQLRSYQRDGVDWLAFLHRFGLHGILCDDMGLGKTLQTLCILATSSQEQAAAGTALPSLVVCPTTLVGHWRAEAARYVGHEALPTLAYAGSPALRAALRPKLLGRHLVVTSYETLRADVEHLAALQFDYLVLDEGHVIKNGRSKLSAAAKRLFSRHRLLLSGTPLQNHAVELWSLFDFLMPGFLGSESEFRSRYAKPIHAAEGAGADETEFFEGEAALKRLHRQVLPFCLRRTKDKVLSELPPKIISDRVVELHPLQAKLYAAFGESPARRAAERAVLEVAEAGESADDDTTMLPAANGVTVPPAAAKQPEEKARAASVLTALHHLRRVCNHPALAVDAVDQSTREECEAAAAAVGGSLRDLQFSPKLQALQQILLECGIGACDPTEAAGAPSGEAAADASVAAAHRALVFSQGSAMLDLVETELFARHMPTVSHLRLDGRVQPSARHGLVEKFNADPTIDLMLLTTSVGGLGLNLTAADTVIFLDHDWNPSRDLQAMDRAHRLGQKRAVSVFRLIARHTLEEKIMSLQRFKLHVANSVVNAQNASLEQMKTDELLDLFELSPTAAAPRGGGSDGALAARGRSTGVKSLLSSIGELWGSEEYDEEYDVDNFLDQLE